MGSNRWSTMAIKHDSGTEDDNEKSHDRWTKMGIELNKNAQSSQIIAGEVKILQDKLKNYQDIIASASELCTNSAQVINDKNDDLERTKGEMEQMRNSHSKMAMQWQAIYSKLADE